MIEKRRKTFWWWPWQIEKVEAYLEKQAGDGWVLANAGGACTSFTFEKRDSARIRYCLDYQDKNKPEYQALFQDAGWKLEYQGSGWYIWSMPYHKERPEIYTDEDSLIRRNSTILGSLSAVLAAQVPLATVMLQNLDDKSPFALAFMILWGLIIALLAGIVIGTAIGVSRLKRRKANHIGAN